MLRIDLLPAYVAQRRLTRQLTVLFIGILSAIVVLGLGYAIPLKRQVADVEQQVQTATAFQTQVTKLQSDTAAITAQKPAYDAKVQFVSDVRTNNLAYPTLYRKLAKYTVPSILYSSMSVTGTAVSIAAYTPSLADLSSYLAHIWNDPDLKTVTVSAFPGYKDEYDPSSKDYTLPQLPPGFVAHFKNSSQVVKSFTVSGGVVTKIVSGNESNEPTASPTNTEKPKFDARHSGFDFTVSAVLKQAIPVVNDPGTAPAATGGAPGGPGGPGGPGAPPMPGGPKA